MKVQGWDGIDAAKQELLDGVAVINKAAHSQPEKPACRLAFCWAAPVQTKSPRTPSFTTHVKIRLHYTHHEHPHRPQIPGNRWWKLRCSPRRALSVHDLKRLFTETLTNGLLHEMVEEIQADWRGRGIELVEAGVGLAVSRPRRVSAPSGPAQPGKTAALLAPVMETVAIIAYRQPVTRGDIEAIRGVSVSSSVTQTLTERGWIEVIGHKEVPGRPGLYATTRKFLDDLGLASLKDLPAAGRSGQPGCPRESRRTPDVESQTE